MSLQNSELKNNNVKANEKINSLFNEISENKKNYLHTIDSKNDNIE